MMFNLNMRLLTVLSTVYTIQHTRDSDSIVNRLSRSLAYMYVRRTLRQNV